ncbi:hypothetical protein DHC50_15390 [Arenibacter sp. A80]|nr:MULTISPECIES: OmpH family outer membrane protein [unclassified Arenibacter]MCM4164984.1 hypothetical protein [Arenibacter sp. A80]RFT55390.1 OmpH family outer membrane protein [Arenibacter sp. P308M17]
MGIKSKVLLSLAATLFLATVSAQRTIRIGYVDMEYILENVEEYREANEQLADKVQKWKLELDKEKGVIDQMKKDLMAEKVLLTEELISERQEEIQILEKEMFDYQQDRFGPEGDLVLQKARLIQPIQDQVFNEVQKIGANKKYDFIFDKSADVVMLYSEKRHDISDLVLRGISRTRKISAPKNRQSAGSSFENIEEEEAEENISDAILERQERAKQAEEARTKTAEENRAEQLKIREERKKAYEERRKKLLEEREAKRKKELEERSGKNDPEEQDSSKDSQ